MYDSDYLSSFDKDISQLNFFKLNVQNAIDENDCHLSDIILPQNLN